MEIVSTAPTEQPNRRTGVAGRNSENGSGAELRMLAGRYEVRELIGRGGMADVHRGVDTRLGRTVAIKLLRSSLANDPAFRLRFRQEAQSAARMTHPTIVRVFDAGEETLTSSTGSEMQQPFIVMEHVDGRLLKDMIRESALTSAEAVHIIDGVLTALEYSHRAGVVHRDIKPGNIMVTRTGQVKVMDFGIARAIADSSATVAQTTAILGTAQYFSPEQARGESVDARTDLYSCGIVLFEMLAGRPPFRGETPVAVAYQHVSEPPKPPSTYNPAVSEQLDRVAIRSLEKQRGSRYQSAAEFREEVHLASSGSLPKKRLPAAPDFQTTLFGADDADASGPAVAMRQLAVDDVQVTRTQHRPPIAWIWAGVVSVAVIVLAVVFWVMTLTPTGTPEVTVPDLVSQSRDAASAMLIDESLIAGFDEAPSSDVPEGQVISSAPAAGEEVPEGSTVTLVISTGPATAQVPEVAGGDRGEAETAIVAAGLRVGSTTMAEDPSAPAGQVLRSDPEAGTQLGVDSVIDLVVSNGQVRLPDMLNQPIEDATERLEDLGLEVSSASRGGCGAAGNTVIGQDIRPGNVPQRSAVVLSYCDGS